MRKDLSQRVTDEQPEIALHLAKRQGAATQVRTFVGVPWQGRTAAKPRVWGEFCGALDVQTLPAGLPTQACPLK